MKKTIRKTSYCDVEMSEHLKIESSKMKMSESGYMWHCVAEYSRLRRKEEILDQIFIKLDDIIMAGETHTISSTTTTTRTSTTSSFKIVKKRPSHIDNLPMIPGCEKLHPRWMAQIRADIGKELREELQARVPLVV